MQTLHVHLDESGDLEFSPDRSRYYVFAVAWTYRPLELAQDLQHLRFDLVKQGFDLERFHAADDLQGTRRVVLDTIASRSYWKYAAVVIEKSKVPPEQRKLRRKFYTRFLAMPLRFVLRGPHVSNARRVLVYSDRLPFSKREERKAIIKTAKKVCKHELPRTAVYRFNSHVSASNAWLQVVDYCAWSVFRKWERGDTEAYDQLRPRLADPEKDVLRDSTDNYY